MKYVADSFITDGATSSGPHGISLSTTMDDDVFMDGTLREEVQGKTLDSPEEVSERSMVKVSPGAVRQEVSQAISDKKGTLIILKEAEDNADTEGKEMSAVVEKEEPFVPGDLEADRNEMLSVFKETGTLKEDTYAAVEGQTAVVKIVSSTVEIKTDDMTQIKGTDSPKKAMASWISEEVKTEVSEVIDVSAKEVKEMETSDVLQPKSTLTQITVSESSAASLAVVLYEN